MKNNGKKLLAGLGIGLTLAGGSMMMTGCTGVTEADSAKLWETVDEIKDSISILEERAIKEKAFNLYWSFMAKVATLDGDIYDNVKISGVDINGRSFNFTNYKMSNGKMICYSMEKGYQKDVYEKSLYYEMDEMKTLCSDFVNKEIETEFFYRTHKPLDYFIIGLATGDRFKTFDSVIGCEILENGNYKLSMFDKNNSFMNVFEITDDAYIVSATFIVDDCMRISVTYNFEYGVVTEKEMQEKLDIVNALPEKV